MSDRQKTNYVPPELLSVDKKKLRISEFISSDVERHDPSNIIRHNGKYYLWWMEHPRGTGGWKAGYIPWATSEDGYRWAVQGVALTKDAPGAWDELAVLAPYVVPNAGKFYMFYSGASKRDWPKRGMGFAVADTPDGPWKKHEKPILWPGDDGAWDDMIVADVNIILYRSQWLFYYKGRTMGDRSGDSQVGMAISDNLTGPYTRHSANPLFKGHAFSAWVHRNGVAAIGGGNAQVVYWSPDGIHFTETTRFENNSTGFYCPENFGNGINNRGVTWGFDTARDITQYIFRFDCTMGVAN